VIIFVNQALLTFFHDFSLCYIVILGYIHKEELATSDQNFFKNEIHHFVAKYIWKNNVKTNHLEIVVVYLKLLFLLI